MGSSDSSLEHPTVHVAWQQLLLVASRVFQCAIVGRVVGALLFLLCTKAAWRDCRGQHHALLFQCWFTNCAHAVSNHWQHVCTL